MDDSCRDCLTTHMTRPREAPGRAERCPEHQRLRNQFLAKGRKARERARRAGRNDVPSPEEWAAAYGPVPLHEGARRGALLTPGDLEEIVAVTADLREAMDAGNNAYRSEDPTATRWALRGLLDRAHEAVAVLEQIPGVQERRSR